MKKVQYIKKKYYPVKHFTIITIAGKQKNLIFILY